MDPELRPELPPGCAIPPEELQALVEAVRHAFGLAKGGAAAQGYQLLRQERERVVQGSTLECPWGLDLVCQWDTALAWYEQWVPPVRLDGVDNPSVDG